MTWIPRSDAEWTLEDDTNFLVCNMYHKLSPIRAYYQRKTDSFHALDALNSYPLDITHYMELPQSLYCLYCEE